jgi:tetratricopeptide (TPR) repeat protein
MWPAVTRSKLARPAVVALNAIRRKLQSREIWVGTSPFLRASALCRSGCYSEARPILERLLAETPRNVEALSLMAEVEDRAGNISLASDLLDRALLENPSNAALLFRRGVLALRSDHQQLSKAAEAEALFARAAEADPNMAEAHFHRGIAMYVQNHVADSIEPFAHAAALEPAMVKAHYELAKALSAEDRLDEAKAALGRVVALEPAHKAARKDLADLLATRQTTKRRSLGVRFPPTISAFQDLKYTFRHQLLNAEYPKILTASSIVATFGSCFAGNVARALRNAGVNARNTTFGEFVNSTAANRHYIDWVVDGVKNEITEAIAEFHAGDPNFSGDPSDHRRRVAESDIIVLTVGVAPGYFRRGTGELVVPRPSSFNLRALLKECEFRTTTVADNVANLQHILAQLRRVNPKAHVVITVSPVPLGTTFEYESAIVADCVSKSTLRVAVDELMRENLPGLMYWPSFELFRWVGSYVPNLYGMEDRSTVHASEFAVAVAVDAFVDVLSGGTLGKSAPDAQ